MFLPAGSQDEIGNSIIDRFKAYEIFRSVTSSRGFKQISTPVVEYAETFTNPYAGMALTNMLKWFDHDGKIEVLRPDWTAAIARALDKQHPSQLKWAYQGSVFRRDKDGMESSQAGIEIVHTPVFLGESECLLTAVAYLKALNLDNYLIELGHTGIFEQLTSRLQLSEVQFEKLRQAMHDKRTDVVYELASNAGSEREATALTDLIEAYGSFEVIEAYEKKWQDHPELLAIIQHIKQLATIVKESGGKEVTVDLGRVKNLPYYCGTMFRGYLKNNGATCFSGGRYDKLYEQFEHTKSAVGLAFDVDVLAENISFQDEREAICILATPESHSYAEQLRLRYEEAIVDIQYELSNRDRYQKIIQVTVENNEYKVVER